MFTKNKHLNAILLENGTYFILAFTSIFFFLSIISSHYTETSFFRTLIIKLVGAMTYLCESILFVILAFSDNFGLVFPKKYLLSQYLMTTFSYIVCFLFLYWWLANIGFLWLSYLIIRLVLLKESCFRFIATCPLSTVNLTLIIR